MGSTAGWYTCSWWNSTEPNSRQFYSYQLYDLSSDWQQDWSWPCFDTDLAAFVVEIKLFLFIYLFMLTSWHLHDKSWDTSNLACTHGQLTKHTTVKWPISAIMQQNHMNSFFPVSIWFEAGWELLSTKPNCKQFFPIKHTKKNNQPETVKPNRTPFETIVLVEDGNCLYTLITWKQ